MPLSELHQTLAHRAFLRAQPAIRRLFSIGAITIPTDCILLEAINVDLGGVRRAYLLAFESVPGDGAQLAELLGWLASSGSEVFVASDDTDLPEWISAGPGQRFEHLMGVKAVFERFVSVTEGFSQSPLIKTRDDFPVEAFRTIYHSRQAHVLNWPGRGTSSGTGSISMEDMWEEWNGTSFARPPILLLGDRGSGKTWELLHYTTKTTQAALEAPWRSPLPFYVPLSDFREYFSSHGLVIPSLPRIIRQRYPEVTVAYGDATFEGLFECGHFVACLDGLDEILLSPDDRQVNDTFQRLISESSLESSLIFSARESHFKSLQDILNLEIWDGARLLDHFIVLRLDQFNSSTSNDVARLVTAHARSVDANSLPGDFDIVTEFLASASGQEGGAPLSKIVFDVVASHPALVTELASRLGSGHASAPRQWAEELLDVIDTTMLEYNLIHERTTDMIAAGEGRYVRLGATARKVVLEEFAHILAVRHRDELPAHLASMKLGVLVNASSSEIEREFRVQTVLELAEDEESSSSLQFALRFRSASTASDEGEDKLAGMMIPEALHSLWEEARAAAPVAVSSVCGAAYLARWVSRRLDLTQLRAESGSSLQHREELLSAVGLFPLGPAAGSILRSLLEGEFGDREGGVTALKTASQQVLQSLAGQSNLRIYSPRLRYLCHNLEALGLVTPEERRKWDPWSDDICSIAAEIPLVGRLTMILVPPVRDSAVTSLVSNRVVGDGSSDTSDPPLDRPYLMGVSEVTNAQFQEFLESAAGRDWDVKKVTRAGGGAVSDGKALYTNEYHLYHWHRQGDGRYVPPDAVRQHPVVYVSWYAADDYCKWLTSEATTRSLESQAPSQHVVEPKVYRLPTAAEWLWVAQGGYSGVQFPWDLHGGIDGVLWPFEAGNEAEPDSDRDKPSGLTDLAFQRDRLKKLLLDDTKQTRPVGTELLSSFGAFGLVGNVKEWGSDKITNGKGNAEKKVILGGSASLGGASFAFNYYAYLFPENTNPDVGFRVCRSLTELETDLLRSRELAIASLATDGETGKAAQS